MWTHINMEGKEVPKVFHCHPFPESGPKPSRFHKKIPSHPAQLNTGLTCQDPFHHYDFALNVPYTPPPSTI